MFKQIRLKTAARRIQQKTTRRPNTRRGGRGTGFWGRVWNIICAPFRFIARVARRIWAWICAIDMIGLINMTLLIAIIVLFSILIIDITMCGKCDHRTTSESTVVVDHRGADNVRVVSDRAPAEIRSSATLAARRITDRAGNTNKKCDAATPKAVYGDVIIERNNATILQSGMQINGNLYLQHMRKYTLPCGVKINGNMFLRDLDLLRFCGEFTVTGNIYVSPRSSFGPIPRNARIGGHVIL